MSRYLVFLILCLTTIKNGFCLKCYASNYTKQSVKIQDIKHELKECQDVLNEIRKKQGLPARNITIELCCYTVTATGLNGALTGCFPKNGCQEMKPSFKKMFKPPPEAVYCTECEEDGCNAVTYRSVKLSDSSSAENVLVSLVASFVFVAPLILQYYEI
ncbi:uncharacterized protein LOC135132612 [Zophobas morio]|uniref:uncharacterized protein LOC135132612 n=1 Tax=Zophobas morio TaxID=2755281 RepID=UPI00308271B6